jgi:hypothetical protein
MPAIKETIDNIVGIFHQVSGLRPLEERISAYYCLSTWFLNKINPFPVLCIIGPNGTGKSSLLAGFERLAFNPYKFTAMQMSGPAFRDELGKAHEGTAVIEECDSTSDDIEAYLGLRYMRETAVCAKKIPAGIGAWKTIYIPIFGPSIIHKRIPFRDPALEGRSITITTAPDLSRKYKRIENFGDDVLGEIKVQEAKIKLEVKLTDSPSLPDEVAPRVADSYKPVISLMTAAEDTEFLKLLWDRLREATQSLKDGQQYEPGPIVVQALISALTKNEDLVIKNVRIEGELLKIIQYDFGFNLNSRQVAKILRGYGFELRRIGGPYSVISDINTLVKVAKLIGIEDDAVDRAAKGIVNKWRPEDR